MPYYAVAIGKQPGIYNTWDECSQQVLGYPNSKYKKFKTHQEAINFIDIFKADSEDSNHKKEEKEVKLLSWENSRECDSVNNISKKEIIKCGDIEHHKYNHIIKYKGNILYQGLRQKIHKPIEGQAVAYVDGSFNRNVGYGSIIILSGEENYVCLHGRLSDPVWMKHENVSGELAATLVTLQWAKKNFIKDIEIYHDYEGIQQWATGKWKTNNELTKHYKEQVAEYFKHMNIHFKKVKSHTGDFYNEVADRLASM